jgi:hypothetical protein
MPKYRLQVIKTNFGWYADVIELATGKDAYMSRLFATEELARTDGKLWIEAAICFAR